MITVDVVGLSALASRLAEAFVMGDCITLDGPMGAGKTTWIRECVRALGGDPAQVSSPTFSLMHRYHARIPVLHLDAWRMRHSSELTALGFDELAEEHLSFIEWSSRVADRLPKHCWRLTFDHDTPTTRLLTVRDPQGNEWIP